ncbi:MAG: histone deacetylase [Acidobacteriota bacterium]|nr:histone deacetylase [Acidobacteriota bacterium]
MNTPSLAPPLVIRSHPLCLEHRPGLGHPEAPDRLQVVLDALSARVEGRWSVDRESALPPEEDILGCLAWIHDKDYIERVREASQKGSGWLDSQDCGVSTGTFDAAVASAGLAMQAALDLVNGRITRAFVVARPPSHHAHRDRASGYCFFNATALAAEIVTRSWRRPVVIADFGALHGDGTQEMFFDRDDVGYVSVHRYPAFPGTGGADEIGDGPGKGTTRNVPLAAGADDDVVCAAFDGALNEICSLLQPAALILSAGFDAHPQDVLGGMAVTPDGFRRLSASVVKAAETWSGGRLLSFLDAGFNLEALANTARIHAEELAYSSSEILLLE